MKSRIYYPSRHEKLPDNLPDERCGVSLLLWSRGEYTIRRSAILPETDLPSLNVLVRVGPCVDGSELARTFSDVSSIGRCGHVFGLLARFT
jgi:hypothetical protein